MQRISLAFGSGQVTVSLPEHHTVAFAQAKKVPALPDVAEAVRHALRQPLGALPLAELVTGGQQVAIVVSDITRQWIGYDKLLPPLLDELNQAGVPDQDILLVVALGAHRRHTDEENVLMYSQPVVNRVRLVQSTALEQQEFVRLGTTTRGVPVAVHKAVATADTVILTGGITYHPMAGFSGGRKAIMPGVSSYASIQGNHRFCLQPQPGCGIHPDCRSGNLTGNEMHLDMLEMAAMVQPAFLMNAVYNAEGEAAGIFAGHWETAWQAGCREVEQMYSVPVSGSADIVLASAGGFPQDINFYQASKAIENACDAMKEGAILIAVMECRDIAEPADFSKWFTYASVEECEQDLRTAFTVPGFVALKLQLIAQQHKVLVVTLPENHEFINRAGMQAVESLAEAFAIAEKLVGKQSVSVLVIPQGGHTLPVRSNICG